jgi:hypothetical protein
MTAKGYKKDNLYPSETTADAGKPLLSDTINDTQSGHCRRAERCPLLGVKRTSQFQSAMSAFDPKRTFPSDALTTSNLPV